MIKNLIFIFSILLLAGCMGGGESQIELSGFDTSSSGSSTTTKSANVTSANIVNNQLVLGGTNLDTVTNVRVTGPSSFDETFAIESQSNNSLIANGLNNIAFAVAGAFSLIITDAQGASSYTITFSIADDSITGAMISDMSASNGDALTFNSGTGEWEATPLSGLNMVGTWNANTDSPDLADGGANTTPANGDFYVVGTAGTTSIDGNATWNAGDWILFNGSTWERVANSSAITSFNGRVGAVTPATNDYTWAQIDKTTSPIDDLSDVDTSGAISGSVLKFDGTNWIVGTDNDSGGAGSGSLNSATSSIINADNDGNASGDIDFQINSSTVASIKNNGDFVVGTNTFVVDDSTSSIGIGVLAPSYDLSLSGDSDKAIGMERHTTSDTAGSDLFLYTGGATSGATDKDGGDLYIASGTATGSGTSNVYIQTSTASGSGTSDNAPTTKLTVLGSGNVGIGTNNPGSKLEVDGDITVTTGNDVCISGGNCLSSVGGGGETNTASNVGTAGIGVYKQKTTANLEFKNINAGSTKITLTDDTPNNEIDIDVDESNINHDNLSGFVANEHIDHSSVSVATGANSGLTGGGDLTSTRNLSVDITGTTAETAIASADEVLIYDASATALRKMTWSNFVNGLATSATTITTGDGITGGGDLSTNRTISIDLATNPGLEFSSNQLRAKVNTGLTLDSNGINVNVGTGANQIVQLDGSSRLPAVDGSLLTNVASAVDSSLALDGDSAKTISMDRHSTADTAGNDLTVSSGGATTAATDKDGGDLILSSGTATGTGSSSIEFQTATAQGSTNTTDNTPDTKMVITGEGNVGIGTTAPTNNFQIGGSSHAGYAIGTRTAIYGAVIETEGSGANAAFRVRSDVDATPIESFYVTNSGNVGIGTTSPSGKLDIEGGDVFIGTGTLSNASGNEDLSVSGNLEVDGVLYGDGSGLTNITASSGGASNTTDANINADSNGDASGDIHFQINGTEVGSFNNNGDFVADTNTLVVDASANAVGIGVLAPTYDLSFGGNATRTIAMERHTTSDTAGNDFTLGSGGATSGATDKDGGDVYIKGGTSTGTGTSNIYLQTATAGSTGTSDNAPDTKMTILGSGNVGIGTTSPSSKLHIVNGQGEGLPSFIEGDMFIFQNNASNGASSVFNVLAGSNGQSKINFSDNSDSNIGSIGYRHGTGGDEMFFVTNNSQRMVVDSGGNVGIGTTAPDTTALLQLDSTTKGFRAPAMTTTQRDAISTPLEGLMIYNDTTDAYNYFDGSAWTEIGNASSSDITFNKVTSDPSTSSGVGKLFYKEITNTTLLLHGDGSDASTTFTDSSNTGHTVTAVGNSQIDTAESKFGGASMLFDGSGDEITVSAHSDFNFGTDNFTIDFWYKHGSTTNNEHFFGLGNGTESLSLQFENSTTMRIYNFAAYYKQYTVANIATGSWTHIALVRNGDDLTIYVNGVESSSDGHDLSGADLFPSGNPALAIGRNPYYSGHSAQYMQGHIDEFRISKGIARWTANFTAPTAAFDATSHNLYFKDENGTTTQLAQSSGSSSDNLGNHTASQNIQLGSNYLSGDGDNEGIQIDSSGNVTIAQNATFTGNVDMSGATIADNSITVGDVDFASTNGINIPQVASAPGSPTAGQMYYNTSDNKLYVYNSSSWEEVGSGASSSGGGGLVSIQVFDATSDTTWTKPAGISTVKVFVTGGGGGGGAHNSDDAQGGGGAGGTAIEVIDVSSVSSVSLTVGAGGSGACGNSHNGGTAGGTTSFGSYLSATGGSPPSTWGIGGAGGTGQNGDINLRGNDGGGGNIDGSGNEETGGTGGASYWSGAGRGASHWGAGRASLYGSGGGGAHASTTNCGYAGGDGVIIVYEYGNFAAGSTVSSTTDVILSADTDTNASGEIQLFTNNTQQVTVDNDGNVGIGTTDPNASALLELSSTTKGFRAPAMTTTQRDAISTPLEGLMIYNDTTDAYNYYDGSSWSAIGSSGGSTGLLADAMGLSSSTWPDAIECGAGSPHRGIFILKYVATGNTIQYQNESGLSVAFNSDGTFSSSAGGSYSSGCASKSISTIKSEGRGLYFGTTLAAVLNDGSAGTPGLSFAADTDTGIYRPTDNNFALVTNGSERLRIDASGNVGIGSNAPTTKLDVNGTVTATTFAGSGASLTNIPTAAIADNAITVAKVDFASTDGINIPQLASAPGSPTTGQIYYNTGDNKLYVYNSSSWEEVGSGSSGSGNLEFYAANTALVTGITYHSVTPTNHYPVTVPSGTKAVRLRVDYLHNGAANHGYLGFWAYQKGATLAEDKVYYDSYHYDLYYNSDTTDLIIPWSDSLDDEVTIEVHQSYNTSSSNTYSIYHSGHIVQTGGDGTTIADSDSDTSIQVEESADEDKIRFDTAGSERMIIDENGNIGVGTSTPNATAIMQLESTTKGFRAPAMTTTQRDAISTPLEGLMIYNDTDDKYNYYDGSVWNEFGGSGTVASLITGWPDAIVCTLTNPNWGKSVFRLIIDNYAGDSLTYYRYISTGTQYDIRFNASTKAFDSYVNVITSDCNKSISDLTSEGKAKYFGNEIAVVTADADDDTKIMVEKNSDEDKIRFDTAGSERVIIDESGNMGIGSTSPTTKLDVSGTVTATTFAGSGANLTNIPTGAISDNAITVAKVDFASTDGINIPQLASAPGSPTTGQMYYNTSDNKLYVYNGSTWQEVGSGGSSSSTVAFHVNHRNSATTLTISGGNVVPFDTALQDTHSAFNLATEEFTAPESGQYVFGWHFYTGSATTANRRVTIQVDTGGGYANIMTTGNTNSTTNASTLYYLNSGDKIRLYVPGGYALDTYSAAAHNGFWGIKVGAGATLWSESGSDVYRDSGNVGIGTNSPNSTAILHLDSTTKGFRAPAMTTAQRDAISTPLEGLMIYNDTTNAYNFYDGSVWGSIGSGNVTFGTGNSGFVGAVEYAGAANCRWETSSTSWGNFSADSDCNIATSTGAASVPDTAKTPALKIASLPAGVYRISATGVHWASSSTACQFKITDGTNSSPETYSYDSSEVNNIIGEFTYSSAQTNITFNIQGKVYSGGGSCNVYADNNTSSLLRISVQRIDGNTSAVLVSDDDGDTTINSETSTDEDDLRFRTNGSERMIIDETGNVGIGSTSPTTKLDVDGTVTATAFAGSGANLTNIPTGAISDNAITVAKVDFASTDGINIPQLASAPGSPTTGQIYYNTGDNTLYVYNGSSWQEVGATGGFTLEDWQSVTFENSWVNLGGAYSGAAYYKDPFGVVHLRGVVANGTTGASVCIFTLPSGSRPVNRELVDIISNNALGRIHIDNTGCVSLSSGSNSWVSLDGITFRSSSGATFSGNANPWAVSGSDVTYSAGNVGIGSSTPTTKLDVNGTVTATAFAGSGANLTNIPTAAIDNGAITVDKVDFASSNGINIPQLASDPGSPTTGLQYFNTTSNTLKVYNGTSWVDVGSGSSGGAVTAWAVFNGTNGTIIRSSGISTITRTATGKYTVAFSSNMSNANYAVLGSMIDVSAPSYPRNVLVESGSKTVSQVNIVVKQTGGAVYNDVNEVYVAILDGSSSGVSAVWSETGSDIYRASGNVGIGTTTPARLLEVEGTTSNYIAVDTSSASAYTGLEIRSQNAVDWYIRNNYANSDRLDIVNGGGTGVYLTDGGTSWTSTSDKRWKENWTELDHGIEKINSLSAGTYNYIDNKDKRHVGLIAQEVDKVLPDAVDKSDKDKWGIRYTEVIPLIVKAFQELYQWIVGVEEKQDRKIAAVEEENKKLKEEVEKQKEENEKLKKRLELIEKKLGIKPN